MSKRVRHKDKISTTTDRGIWVIPFFFFRLNGLPEATPKPVSTKTEKFKNVAQSVRGKDWRFDVKKVAVGVKLLRP